MSKSKPNRSRPHSYHIYLNDAEVEMIKNGMEAAHIDNFSKYARRMLTGGYILHVEDTNDIKAVGYELNKIGNNINQIAKVANTTGTVSEETIKELKERMDDIWQLQRSLLSENLSMTR